MWETAAADEFLSRLRRNRYRARACPRAIPAFIDFLLSPPPQGIFVLPSFFRAPSPSAGLSELCESPPHARLASWEPSPGTRGRHRELNPGVGTNRFPDKRSTS